MSKRIACIGSRSITPHQERLLFSIGANIAERGWYVSSGNALGSDEYFGKGVNSVDPSRLILYLPWTTYNEELLVEGNRITSETQPEWEEIARKHHARWDLLKRGGRAMMQRNVGIVKRADAVLAVLNHSKPGGGGTGQGWRISETMGLPRLDVSGAMDFETVISFLDSLAKTPIIHTK